MYWTSSPRPWPGFGADRFKSKIYLYVFRPSPEYYSERDAACMRSLHSEGKAERRMKSTGIGIGMLGGMALPALFGIAFYGEPFTPAVAVCFALITAAVIFSVS